MIEFYHHYSQIIIYLHIVFDALWVGVLLGYVLTAYPSIKQIPNTKLLIRTALRTIRRLSNITFVVSILVFLSGLLIYKGEFYADLNPLLSTVITTKAMIWIFMFVNTLFILKKTVKARKMCLASDSGGARDSVSFISHYLIILNIFIGIIAIYFGMCIR